MKKYRFETLGMLGQMYDESGEEVNFPSGTEFHLAGDWQPIETAPRGGKWLLVWWPQITDCALVAYRGPDGWRSPVGSYGGYLEGEQFGKPSHWMPLPDGPPSSGGSVT